MTPEQSKQLLELQDIQSAVLTLSNVATFHRVAQFLSIPYFIKRITSTKSRISALEYSIHRLY